MSLNKLEIEMRILEREIDEIQRRQRAQDFDEGQQTWPPRNAPSLLLKQNNL